MGKENTSTTTKKSRAEYYRQRRRKKGPKRLEEAARNRDRKRDKRGGYKNVHRKYEELKASQPEEVLAQDFFDYPQDFSPLPRLLDIPFRDGEITELRIHFPVMRPQSRQKHGAIRSGCRKRLVRGERGGRTFRPILHGGS